MEGNFDDIKSEIEALKAAREAEYKKIHSELSAAKYESKLASYKIKSAIKYESHITSKKHSELQTQLSTVQAAAVVNPE